VLFRAPILILCWVSALSGRADLILHTDFTGRTVSGKTAQNLTWQTLGVQDPGSLTAVDEPPVNAAFAGLFDTPNAQGHFAPDKNIDNEGPWSVTIPLTLVVPQIQLTEVVLDWQHFNNVGVFQTVARPADWTVSVSGSGSGLLANLTQSGVSGISGLQTFTFASPLNLTDAETWSVRIHVIGTGPGNNTGLDALTLNGTVVPEPGAAGLFLLGLGLLAAVRRSRAP
jgi:hypothetical protein